ncbi:MAG: glycosyltransferase family 4 protein, partial [Oscillochloris sp.]|nr:glycosyltransferase family 4 protein [Oscillochloris sp.]
QIADLLRAFAILHNIHQQARLVVIGDGPEHGKLKRLAEQLQLGAAVRLLGGLPDDDEVVSWYRRASIFCLPSVQEGFGIVFLEAMAAGLPIVAINTSAIPEVVPHERAGLLAPPRDPQALAETLLCLLEQPQLRAELGAYGREHVAGYDWPQVAEQFLAAVS